MRTGKRLWIVTAIVVLLPLTLVAAALIVVSTADLNRARPWLNRTVSSALERPFAIRGDITLHWQRDREATAEAAAGTSSVLARWIPLPVFSAGDVVLGNPSWSPNSDMATVGGTRFGIALLPLLARTIAIRGLALDDPKVSLLRQKDGQNNWTFASKSSASPPWSVRIDDLKISNGNLVYADAALDLDLQAKVATLAVTDPKTYSGGPLPYGAEFVIDGRYRNAKVEVIGRTGRVLSLRDSGGNFPLMVNARSGKVTLRAKGTLENPRALSGLNMKVKLGAPSAAMLYPLTGLLLPNTPPLTTTGTLVGKFAPNAAAWEYREFSGRVGSSDIRGNLRYRSGQPRPKLSGTVTSNLLQLADLGALVGAGDTPPDAAASEASAQRGNPAREGKVLPTDRFLTNRWTAMDVDVTFAGKRIVKRNTLPINELNTRVVMQDGRLTLNPVSLNIAGGELRGMLSLDGAEDPVRGEVRLSATSLQLSQLFPSASKEVKSSIGQLDGGVALRANGNSMAELLGSSDGDAKIYMRDGTVSKALLELASLNVGGMVITRLFGDRPVNVHCAVADMGLRDGVARTRNVHLSTDEASVDINGTIDFKKELLALEVKPASTKLKMFSLRSPLYVRGTFDKPDVGLQKGPLLTRAGAAAALAFASPLAILVPITVPGAEDDVDCQQLLAQAGATETKTKQGTSAQ